MWAKSRSRSWATWPTSKGGGEFLFRAAISGKIKVIRTSRSGRGRYSSCLICDIDWPKSTIPPAAPSDILVFRQEFPCISVSYPPASCFHEIPPAQDLSHALSLSDRISCLPAGSRAESKERSVHQTEHCFHLIRRHGLVASGFQWR